MQFLINRIFVLVFVFVLLSSIWPASIFANNNAVPESEIIITEIKLGGGDSPKEFVTLYNQTDQAISLNNYKLEYIQDNFTGECNDPDWGGTPSTIRLLDGDLSPGNVLTFKYNLSNDRTLTDDKPGSIRLIEENIDKLIIHDLIGWGPTSVCFENKRALMPSPNESLQRYIDCKTGLPIDSNDNLADFNVSEIPRPFELSGTMTDCEVPDPNNDPEGGMGGGSDDPQVSCSGIVISEVLPNPSGVDSGKEFIELYNPTTDDISLDGCQLETTANNKVYEFNDGVLKPKEYKAFYDSTTGLTLTNFAGGSAYLIYSDQSEQEVQYSPNLEDDAAWALDTSSANWSITYTPTPGSKNIITKIKPCPAGQFRNLDTNRCNTISAEVGVSPCPAGKFRNPETNRCKSILDTSSQLKSCKPGQFRNPDTNRCKSLSSGDSLVPCKPGQERNPDTNRCRKSSGISTSSDSNVKDVLSVSEAQDKTSWAMAGFSFAGASAYAVWEWRREVWEKLMMLKNKLSFR